MVKLAVEHLLYNSCFTILWEFEATYSVFPNDIPSSQTDPWGGIREAILCPTSLLGNCRNLTEISYPYMVAVGEGRLVGFCRRFKRLLKRDTKSILYLTYMQNYNFDPGGGRRRRRRRKNFLKTSTPHIPSHPGIKYPVRASPSLR